MNAPKKLTWVIALIVGGVGIASKFIAIPFVTANAFWFVAAAFVLLLLASLFKGL